MAVSSVEALPLVAAGTPPALVDLIYRCIAKKPEERLQSFGAIAEILQRVLAGATQAAPVPVAAVSGSKAGKGALVAGALSLVLLLGAGAVWYLRRPQPVAAPAPVRTVRGGDVVPVAAGEFLLGPDRKSSRLPAFSMDRTEVSHRAYTEFAQATGAPDSPGEPELPVVNVSFDEAKAFCRWAGKQLPSEEQWEKAARGTDGRSYPWGSEMKAQLAAVKENPAAAKGPVPVASLAAGASPAPTAPTATARAPSKGTFTAFGASAGGRGGSAFGASAGGCGGSAAAPSRAGVRDVNLNGVTQRYTNSGVPITPWTGILGETKACSASGVLAPPRRPSMRCLVNWDSGVPANAFSWARHAPNIARPSKDASRNGRDSAPPA